MLPSFIININEYDGNEDCVADMNAIEVTNIGQGLATNLFCSRLMSKAAQKELALAAGLPSVYYQPGTDLSAFMAEVLEDSSIMMEGQC